MRTLAIGDIHGCNVALNKLLELVQPSFEDQLIFLGDYIDRGPASRDVIETLLAIKKSCAPIFLRGNHEEMILIARKDFSKNDSWQTCGGFETVCSYGAKYRRDWASQVPDSHWKFLEATQNFFETKTHIFVHGCVDPQLAMADQQEWVLFWETFGQMKPHVSGKRVICGHTPQRSGKPSDKGFAVCIDTGPTSGGWLTCLDVNSGAYWQADEKGNTRAGKL
jgi:serine/threonine protein phosphatase 1